MHSMRIAMAAGLMGAAALCFATPAQTSAGEGVTLAPTKVCGTDKVSGLGVSAGPTESCAVALQVAAAYTKVWQDTAGAPAKVAAGGTTWSCQERQGDPNPYQECVDTRDSSRRVTLSS